MANHVLHNNELSREKNMQCEESLSTGYAFVPKENDSVSINGDNVPVLPEPFGLESSESTMKIEEKLIVIL